MQGSTKCMLKCVCVCVCQMTRATVVSRVTCVHHDLTILHLNYGCVCVCVCKHRDLPILQPGATYDSAIRDGGLSYVTGGSASGAL